MTRRRTILSLFTAVMLLGAISTRASAQVDRSPDLATTVPGSWTNDRYAPCGFGLANGVQGRNNVLQASVCATDSQANRPAAYSSTFYNTQGKQIGIDGVGVTPPSSQKLSLDLYVDNNWMTNALNNVSTGMWSRTNQTASDDEADAWYPIIGFANLDGSGGFRFFDPNVGYVDLGATVNYGAWNTLEIDYGSAPCGATYTAVVNGANQYTACGDLGAERITAAFVNTSNDGEDLTVNWSNTPQSVTATPEPASMVLMGTGLIGVIGVARRRRKKEIL